MLLPLMHLQQQPYQSTPRVFLPNTKRNFIKKTDDEDYDAKFESMLKQTQKNLSDEERKLMEKQK